MWYTCFIMSEIIRKRIRFYGQVQGVGFRYRAKIAATSLDVTGWVHNEYDGSVSMEIQGTEAQIDKVILSVERGTYVRITNMYVKSIPVIDNERGFGTR